jgi:tRNA threonylcarbamoyladenosine biosynthesis protein TsaE
MSPNLFTLDLPNLDATTRLGQWLGETLAPGAVLLLAGDLGAGKTSLVQAIATALGITDVVTSPTFTLLCEYPEGRIPLYHFDLYRLEPEGLGRLNLDLYWEGDEVELGIVAIEWSERLRSRDRPTDYLHLALSIQPQGGRQATLTAVGSPPGWSALSDRLQTWQS